MSFRCLSYINSHLSVIEICIKRELKLSSNTCFVIQNAHFYKTNLIKNTTKCRGQEAKPLADDPKHLQNFG